MVISKYRWFSIFEYESEVLGSNHLFSSVDNHSFRCVSSMSSFARGVRQATCMVRFSNIFCKKWSSRRWLIMIEVTFSTYAAASYIDASGRKWTGASALYKHLYKQALTWISKRAGCWSNMSPYRQSGWKQSRKEISWDDCICRKTILEFTHCEESHLLDNEICIWEQCFQIRPR